MAWGHEAKNPNLVLRTEPWAAQRCSRVALWEGGPECLGVAIAREFWGLIQPQGAREPRIPLSL